MHNGKTVVDRLKKISTDYNNTGNIMQLSNRLRVLTGNITIDNNASDGDIIFKGTDNTTDITALTLDMSDGGKAIFGGQASFAKELIVDMPHGGTYTKPAQFLVNDVNNGDHAQFTFGKRLANDELVEFGYYHVAPIVIVIYVL